MPLNGSTCGSTPSEGELREAQASTAPQVLSLLPSDPVSQDGICTQASSSPGEFTLLPALPPLELRAQHLEKLGVLAPKERVLGLDSHASPGIGALGTQLGPHGGKGRWVVGLTAAGLPSGHGPGAAPTCCCRRQCR